METTQLNKTKTNIVGLDKLLFGGFDLSRESLLIVIEGKEDTEKALLGLQMLYGLAQSLDLNGKEQTVFLSNCRDKEFYNDLHLDIVIAECMQRMIEEFARGYKKAFQLSEVTNVLFDTSKIKCRDYIERNEMPEDKIRKNADALICEEILYYNNRTNALHFRTIEAVDNERNIVYERRYNTLGEYRAEFVRLERLLKLKFVDLAILDRGNFNRILHSSEKKEILAVEYSDIKEDSIDFITLCEHMRDRARVSILIVEDCAKFPDTLADIVIKLRNGLNDGYLLQSLSIIKNTLQVAALGWHQYKRRDYGIEIYPSLHLHFQQRRYLQRALTYTHSNVITDTYQQYINTCNYRGKQVANFYEFDEERKGAINNSFEALYPKFFLNFTSDDILRRTFLSGCSFKTKDMNIDGTLEEYQLKEFMYGHHGGVTAIIGESNTYKRFLTFGSMFSSALNKEHTLILLLNKEDSVIRRRLACPARLNNNRNSEKCKCCYQYIHLMNICMGYITPEELIYFLKKQISVTFDGDEKNPIKRIIIDDLQIIDFCFPLLKKSSLFLSALMAVCREEDIELYILCDKNASLMPDLRMLADNVVCTDRDKDGNLLIYIERFAGYNNTPSKIYCGKVLSIKELFECSVKYNNEQVYLNFTFDSTQIKDQSTSSMNHFWNRNIKK
ncbi:hypothetical protein [Bacteroides congonensis]